jgi:hypothetical protein
MNTELNKNQFTNKVDKRLNEIMDGVNFSTLLDEAWDYVCEVHNVYDGQFSESDEHEIERELHKRHGFDMSWYDKFNPSPQKKAEIAQRKMSQLEKFRLEQDQIMDMYKGGDFDE